MPKYEVTLTRDVSESLLLNVQAHNQEQAEAIAQYIAENGKDPWNRKSIHLDFEAEGTVSTGPEILECKEIETDEEPCNHMPEHTTGLWKEMEKS